jgi:hypothetical protein
VDGEKALRRGVPPGGVEQFGHLGPIRVGGVDVDPEPALPLP